MICQQGEILKSRIILIQIISKFRKFKNPKRIHKNCKNLFNNLSKKPPKAKIYSQK